MRYWIEEADRGFGLCYIDAPSGRAALLKFLAIKEMADAGVWDKDAVAYEQDGTARTTFKGRTYRAEPLDSPDLFLPEHHDEAA